jgi:hypothetical protein
MAVNNMTSRTPTFEFDLVPTSGALNLDPAAWRRIQWVLCEFQPAKRVTIESNPIRIHVTAYGEAQDGITDHIRQQVEKHCGQPLRYNVHSR